MQRPDRLFLRSTDAPLGSSPDRFQVSLGQFPVIGAKRCILSQLQVPYVPTCPTFPEWGQWFSVYINGTLVEWNLNALPGGPRAYASVAEFVSWVNASLNDSRVLFGVNSAGKLTLAAGNSSVTSLAVPSTDPAFGWAPKPGQLETANRRLGFTNSNASLATQWSQPPIVAPSWPNLLRTQTIQVCSSLAPTSGVSTSGQTNVIANVGVNVPWLGVLTYSSMDAFPIDSLAGSTIDSVRIDLYDERGQPLFLVPQAVVAAEITLLYE